MATLQEAIENVRRLENLSLNTEEQPNIEAPPASITYTCDFDTNFADKEAFITGISRYMEEAGLHQQLVGCLLSFLIADALFIYLKLFEFITTEEIISDTRWLVHLYKIINHCHQCGHNFF